MPKARPCRPRASIMALVLIAAVLAVLLLAAGVAPTVAQASDGQITGRVTDGNGVPLGDITVAAAPAGDDPTVAVVTAQTNSDGTYILRLAPGDYDVGFNVQIVAKFNIYYQPVIFGGPGPGPDEACTVCHGRPVTVTSGVVTTNINALLPPAPFTLQKTIRPLSGKTIGLVGNTMTFKIGCHIDPAGCHGTAKLHLGSTSGQIIATTTVSVGPSKVKKLRFTIPLAVRLRLAKAGRRGVPATVVLTTPHAGFVTHFKLRS